MISLISFDNHISTIFICESLAKSTKVYSYICWYFFVYLFIVCVYTTAVGMTLEDIQKIKDLKFGIFMLHLPDDKYFILKKTKVYEKVISLLKSEISNFRTMQLKDGGLYSRASSAFLSNVWKTGPITCGSTFYKNKFNRNILLPNCDVVICCMDWGLEYPMGNLLEIEYESLFTSDAHKRMLEQSFTKEEYFICRKCEFGRNRRGMSK